MKFTRRDFLQAAGAATVAGSLPTVAFSADNDIKLGSILDNSGNLDIYGKPMVLATRLAVDENIEAGGLLGRKIKLIQYNSVSDIARYIKYAQQLTVFLQRSLRRRRMRPQHRGHRHNPGAGGGTDRGARDEEVGQKGLRP